MSEPRAEDILDDDLLLDSQLDEDETDTLDASNAPASPDRQTNEEPGVLEDEDNVAAEQRRQHILKSLKTATNARTKYRQRVALGEMKLYDAQTAYRAAVETLLITSEPVLRKFDDPRWHSDEIYVVDFNPPENSDQDRKQIVIDGLNDLFSVPNPIEIVWEVHKTRSNLGTETALYQVPFDALDAILRTAGRALADHGFGIPAEDDSDEWEI